MTELARLYRAGRDRLDLEPDNDTLRSAVNKLRAGLLPGVTPSVRGPLEPPPAAFDMARRQRRLVAIVYAPAWNAGVTERVIEPFRLIHTRRGWEIDAGPVSPDGTPGTFLVDRVHSYTVLDATFELPGNLEQLLVRQGRRSRSSWSCPTRLVGLSRNMPIASTYSPKTKHPHGSEVGRTSRSGTGLD